MSDPEDEWESDVEVLRGKVASWIRDEWDSGSTLREWWRGLFEEGFSFPTWPVGLGGLGVSTEEARVIWGELAQAEVIGPPVGVGQSMGAPTLLRHGTVEQQERFVGALARGEEAWAQLFSEPGAGSDLASLSTRAVLVGDEWIVKGQKVWSSGAETAERGMLLARTDVDQPKHKGITYFIMDMDQPGVEVRPLRQMDGEAHFCEVFLDEARIHADRVVGGVNGGWGVAMTTLAHERAGTGVGEGLITIPPGEKVGLLDRLVGELVNERRERRARSFYAEPEELIEVARDRGLGSESVIRDSLMKYRMLVEAYRLTILRTEESVKQGVGVGPEASILKLALGKIAKEYRALALNLAGPAGALAGGEGSGMGRLNDSFYWSFAANIGGGTDEIQRNVIAERTLGLPRGPRVDRDVPYRELRVGTRRKE